MAWTNFAQAPFMQLLTTLEHWQNRPSRRAPIHDYPGVTLYHHIPDILHVCDKGSTACIIGSTLWVVGFDATMDDSMDTDQRADRLMQFVNEEYVRQDVPHQHRISKLSWSMICTSSAKNPAAYPDFHGCKAAQIRHIVGPVRAIVERFNNDGRYAHLEAVLRNLEKFYAILDSYSWVLPPDAAEECFDAVHTCCTHYCCLAREAAERGLKLFHIIPKFHFWLHIAWLARFCNPKLAWCYSDEDFVGKIAQVAFSVSFGRGPLRLSVALVRRYLVAIALRVHRKRKFYSVASDVASQARAAARA